jgi:hypothetical protein
VKHIIGAAIVVTMIVIGAFGGIAQAQSGFENAPVFQAKDLVAPELLKGPHFTVDSNVPVKEFMYRFKLRTDYGVFDVHGAYMLKIRVQEVAAIAQLDSMSKTKEFAQAAARTVERPVTSTINMVMNPVQTVEGLPSGIGRLFDRIKLGAESVASAATAPNETSQQQATGVAERVGSVTVTALGFEKERRDLAKSLGVDPYTTYPVLSKKLTDMAWVAFSGRFSIQMAMTVLVPYSTAMSAAVITNSTVYDTPQADLINSDQAIFTGTGASPAQVTALMKNTQYSLSVLTSLASAIQRLKGVSGLDSIVAFASTAQTQAQARFVAGAVNMLARYHESTQPLASVAAPGPFIGRAVAGTLVLPAPVDYVPWTERVFGLAQRPEFKAPERTVWISNQASRLAEKELTAQGWRVYQSYSDAAER